MGGGLKKERSTGVCDVRTGKSRKKSQENPGDVILREMLNMEKGVRNNDK